MSRKKALVTAAVVAACIGLYALAGFVGVPRLVRSQLTDLFERDCGRTATLGELRFNPFTLEFEAPGFALPDADGSTRSPSISMTSRRQAAAIRWPSGPGRTWPANCRSPASSALSPWRRRVH